MTDTPTVLAVLLDDRGLNRYGAFSAAYQAAARAVDPRLADRVLSRAQFHRWVVSGEVRGLPYTDNCRVLEHLFAGYTAAQLFQPCPARIVPAPARANGHPDPGDSLAPAVPGGLDQMAGVEAVFASRSEFAAHVQPQELLEDAASVRAAGLSLNMICQHLPDPFITRLVTSGTALTCLFLDPDGEGTAAREREEGYQPGNLATLTQLNIDLLTRLRDRLPAEACDRLVIAVYDETVRFNILIAEGRACVVQPYLPQARGVDSPTLLIRPGVGPGSLYPVFEHVWEALAERSKPL